MTVCFQYRGGGSSHWPHQQGFRLLQLQSLTELGGHDVSHGAIAGSAAEGIHPAINVSLNTQDVVFLVDSTIKLGDPLANGAGTSIVTSKILFNGQGYGCLSRNARDSYQGIWVRECDVFPAALPRRTVPRPHAPMVSAQRSGAAPPIVRRNPRPELLRSHCPALRGRASSR
jgi:hypothetical protein